MEGIQYKEEKINKVEQNKMKIIKVSNAFKEITSAVNIKNFELSYNCIDIFRKILIKEIKKLKYHRKLFIDLDDWTHKNKSTILCMGFGILPKKYFKKLKFKCELKKSILHELTSYHIKRKEWRKHYKQMKEEAEITIHEKK